VEDIIKNMTSRQRDKLLRKIFSKGKDVPIEELREIFSHMLTMCIYGSVYGRSNFETQKIKRL